MATTTQKFVKDNAKPRLPVSRLTPRPTAASAARAARIANNRNSDSTQHRSSPTRTSHSPSAKAKAPITQFETKEDLKNEAKNVSSNEDVIVPEKNENISQDQIQGDDGHCDINKDSSDVICMFNKEYDVNESNKEGIPDLDEKKQTDDAGDKRDTSDDHESTTGPKTPEKQSRPNTPASRSRPTTPKYSSRPHTPKLPSRPATPAHPVQRISNSGSRPATPQRQSLSSRGRSSSIPVPSRAQTPTSTGDRSQISVKNDEDDIKAVFKSKQKEFHEMKKELDLKQQSVLELFDNLQNLSKRMLQEGITDSGEISELSNFVIFNVADWTTEELSQLCHKVSNFEGAVELINSVETYGENTVSELNTKIMDVPARFAELCLQAFTARQEIIDWLKVILKTNELGSGEAIDRIARYNSQGLEFCEALRELKSLADNIVDTITQFLSRAFRERCTLLSVGKSLVNEITQLREEVNKNSVAVSNFQDSQKEVTNRTESPDRQLEEERLAKTNLKEKLATSESQLRQARVRITKMDRQLREAEASIASLTSTVKSLEDQSRQKEVQLEARARKLRESLKTGELNSNHLAQARDALQTQVQELQQQISTMTEQHKTAIHESNRQLKEAKTSLEEYKGQAQNQEEQNQLIQKELSDSKKLIEELNTKITHYEKSRNSDLPTEREMDLWAELQATKETLRMTEDEVSACKKEKVNFLESFNKISESDRAGTQQKLAAELMSKEEIINKMQGQFRELSKNLKLNEKKVAQYEQYVRDLQEHTRIITGNSEPNPDEPTYEELQQEIMNLRMGLLDSVHKNEQLTELIGQKDQQLDQQDKTSRAQARVIKVREELINMLKSKECEQSRELTALQQDIEHRMKIVDEVNQQIAAKADEIQDLFATLESKQQQIHRLEKIVLALEEQQKRAQAQRTRQEEKIAALEHELAAGVNRRERKFLFF